MPCNTKVNIQLSSGVCLSCNIPQGTGLSVSATACGCKGNLTYIFNSTTQTGTCGCLSPYVLNTAFILCLIPSCNNTVNILLPSGFCLSCNIPQGTGLSVSTTACGCFNNLYFYYDPISQTASCITPPNNNCDYTQGYINYTDKNGKVGCVHCSTFTYSIGTAFNATACNCVKNSVWRQVGGFPIFNSCACNY